MQDILLMERKARLASFLKLCLTPSVLIPSTTIIYAITAIPANLEAALRRYATLYVDSIWKDAFFA